ncbi:MAG: rhomboid family intramembrane serine protease [Halobacteriovoraceae bacterium]|nr:rhomboid family intramembrane serine protease [Halobacteriovoraceae bacterium]
MVSWYALEDGRFWTLLTSVFSHNQLFHLLINMLVLYSFAPFMIDVLGNRRFLFFYLTAGISGSFFHCLTSMALLHHPELPALGASGAIAGVILLFSLLFPKQRLLFFGIIPIRALWGALLFVGIDLWGLIAQSSGGGLPIGHGAHLGGALVGLLYFFRLKSHFRYY